MTTEFQQYLHKHNAIENGNGIIVYPTNTPNKKYLPKTFKQWQKDEIEMNKIEIEFQKEKARQRGEL